MKNLTRKQIDQVKQLYFWTSLNHFHSNKKYFGSILLDDAKEIVRKKRLREILKCTEDHPLQKTNVGKLRGLINQSIECKGTNYFKVLIEGNTGIYYAHPEYQHSDYNKHRVFDKTPETLNLMRIFNALVTK